MCRPVPREQPPREPRRCSAEQVRLRQALAAIETFGSLSPLSPGMRRPRAGRVPGTRPAPRNEAEVSIDQAIEILERLSAECPAVPEYQADAGRCPWEHWESYDLQRVVTRKAKQPLGRRPLIFSADRTARRTATRNSPTTGARTGLAQFRGLAIPPAPLSIWPAARAAGSPNVPGFAAHSVSRATALATGREPSWHSPCHKNHPAAKMPQTAWFLALAHHQGRRKCTGPSILPARLA